MQNRKENGAPLSLRPSFGPVFVCVFHLHGLDLWGLDDRGLRGLDDPVDLHRLSIRELHQGYCGTCCRAMACRHGYLKFRSNRGATLTLTAVAVVLYTICYLCQRSDLRWRDLLARCLGGLHSLLSLLHLHLLNWG